MNSTEKKFLKIYTASVLGDKCDIKNLSDTEWKDLYSISQIHGAVALVYPVIDSIVTENELQQNIKSLWKKNFKMFFIRQSMVYDELKKTVEILYKNGVSPILLKGPYLARFYPQPCSRISSDIDLLINRENAEKAEKILLDFCNAKIIEKGESTYTYSVNEVLHLEVHLTAFAERHGKFFKEFSDYDIFSEKSLCKANILDTNFTVPNCSDMFLYLVCHMAQHLVSNGFGIRQMSDFALFLKHYRTEFNMEYINGILKQLELYTFSQACILICVKYFDITDDLLEIDKEKIRNAAENLLDDILTGGLFGYSSEERKQSGYIVKSAYKKSGSSKNDSRLKDILIKIFPPYSEMAHRFTYCKKHPILLPAAWINRIFGYLRQRNGKNNNYIKSIKDISDIADSRKKLLRELEMF